ncbi:hypothetical protein KY347_05445 [Candidatus Woesearchaeota archaeon]|nr:hypothetical protein [Candidatus Woesearchaeota archaeon]
MAQEEALQQSKQHSGFFRSKDLSAQPDLSFFTRDIGNLSRRLRLIEESFTNIRMALQVTEQNMLSKNKAFSTDIRTLNSDVRDINKEISEIKERIIDMVKELKESAKREEVKVLEKYLDYWSPIKFVTQNEVEEVVREILRRIDSETKESKE